MALNVGELYASFSIDSSGVDGSLSQITNKCNSVASSLTSSGVAMSAAVTAPMLAFGKAMYTAGTDFEAQMDKVGALAGLDLSLDRDVAKMNALTQQALRMGSTTEWTATQAGEALAYMAMAGWDDQSMLAALPAVMNLATAAGADLGTTSDIVTDAMTAFGMTLQSVDGDVDQFAGMTQHFADVLAAAATSSNTNVQLLGTSFKYVAPLAGTLKMSADDCAVALGLMANAGIKGTMSGAALRNILTGLMGTTDTTAAACETLGVSLYNTDGTAKSMMEVMKDLRSSYADNQAEITRVAAAVGQLDTKLAEGKITQAQYDAQVEALTANSSSFMQACVALAGKQGLSGLLAIMSASDQDFEKLAGSIEGCDGAAAQMAATMLGNAKGAVTIFQSSIEGLQITLWNLLSKDFVGLVEKATQIVQSFTSMDSTTQQTILKMAGLSAALGPVLIAAGKLVGILPKIVPALTAMMSPLGIVAAGLLLFGVAASDAQNNIGKMLQSMAKDAKTKLSSFNKTIKTTISTVSKRIPALVKSITNALNDIMPQLSAAISNILVGMMDMIADNADSIVSVGQTIITNLLNGLTAAMPKLIPSAANMVTKIATALINALPKLVEAAGNLVGAIIDGFKNTNWTELGSQILTAIGNAFKSIGSLFAKWFGDGKDGAEGLNWAETGKTIVSKIFSDASAGLTTFNTFLSNLFSQASTNLSSTLSGQTGTQMRSAIVGLLTNILEEAGNMLPQLGNVASTIVTGLAGLLNSIPWADIAADAATLGASLVGFIVKGIEAASDVSVSLVNAIGSMFTKEGAGTQIIDGATTIATSLINAIATAIPTLTGCISDIVTAIGTTLAGVNWAGIVDDLTTLGTAIVGAIVEAIKGAGDIATSIVNAIGTLLSEINWDDVTLSLTGFVDMLVNGITTAISTATDVSVSLIQAISDFFGKIDWSNAALNLSTLATAIMDGIVAALKSIGTASVTLVQALSDMLGKIDWSEASLNLSTLASAIVSGIVKALETITSVSTQLVQAVGDMLGKLDWGAATLNLTTLGSAIVDGIVAAIKAITTVGASLVQAVADLLGRIDWSTVTVNLSALAGVISDGIVAAIGTITTAGVSIAQAIGDFLGKIDWGEASLNLTNLATAITDGIVAALKSIGTASVTLVQALSDMLGKVDWSAASLNLASLANAIVDGIIAAIKTLQSISTDLVQALGDMLGKIDWGAATLNLANLGAAIVDGIVAAIQSIANVSVTLVQAIADLLGKIDWNAVTINLNSLATAISDGIVAAINSLTTASVSITQALGDFLGKINWDEASVNLNSFATTLINGIVAALKAATTGAADIVDAIVDLIGKVNWSQLATTAASLAKTIFDGIVEGFKSLIPDVTQLVAAIGRGISAAGTALGQVAGTLVGELIKFILTPQNWLKLIQLGGKLVEGIATGIYNLGKGILEGAWNFVVGVFDGLFSALGLGNRYSEQTQEAFHQIVETVTVEGQALQTQLQNMFNLLTMQNFGMDIFDTTSLQAYLDAYSQVMTYGTQEMIDQLGAAKLFGNQGVVALFQTLVDSTKSQSERAAALIALNQLGLGQFISDQFIHANDEIVQQARQMANNANEAFLTAFENLGYVIPDAVRSGLEAGSLTVEQAAAQIVGLASTANEQATAEAAAAATGAAVPDELAAAQEAGEGDVTKATETLTEAERVALETFPDVAALAGSDATSGMSDAITNGKTAVVDAMDTLGSEVVYEALKKMSYSEGYTTGYEYTNAVKNGITAAANSVKTAASNMAFSAKTSANSNMTNGMGYSIGNNFSLGIARGIRAGMSSVISAAIAVAQAGVKAAKDTLKIKSPSHVARDEIGYMYDKGLIEGLLSGQSEVANAASGVSDTLHDSFLVGDPSRDTVMSSASTASVTGRQVASASKNSDGDNRGMADAIAEALVASGALNRYIVMDKKVVGEEVAGSVSKTISSESKSSIRGRSVQGVFA